MNQQRCYFIVKILIRKYSTKLKKRPVVALDESVIKHIEAEDYKPKQHPGVVKLKNVHLPEYFVKAVVNAIEDHPVKELLTESEVLVNHLRFRKSPLEEHQFKQQVEYFQEQLSEKQPDGKFKEDLEKNAQSMKDKLIHLMKKNIYNWKQMVYDEYNCLLYLIGRAAPDYAVLLKVFAEIKLRDPNFKPRSFFDFGSGIGTGTWAANNFWKGNIFEYFNVDSSSQMNDLAQILLQGGRGATQMPLKGVFYRQFLPASAVPYDLVVCAYTLLELPSSKARLETVQNLWSKTTNYLVLVEYGTNAGFQVINEARDYLLQLNNESFEGYVFSPCPHEKTCPRISEDETPCNFPVTYQPIPLKKISRSKTELFSYVVLKKGKRNEESPIWPRVVREILVRSKHSICRLCTKEGNLQEIIFTASKHGKITYHCARSTKWGDSLPVSIEEPVSVENEK